MTSPPLPALAAAPLLAAVGRLLRPLVRLLIVRGVTYPMLSDALRDLYVSVAREIAAAGRQKPTDSRLSLLTGLHRKDIRRRRLPPLPAPEAAAEGSVGRRIVARWRAGPPWSSADGSPLPLPRHAARGGASFPALVATVTTDVRPRAVLEALLGEGVVRLDADDRVVLHAATGLPPPDRAARLHHFAATLHDHLAAAAANLAADGRPPFLDRCDRHEGLTPEQTARLAAFARRAAERLLNDVSHAARAMRDTAPSPPEPPPHRLTLGLFLHTGDDDR